MPRRPVNAARELVLPNRDRLRQLRDEYMLQLDATTYDAVRDKFLEELQLKSPSGQATNEPKRKAPRRERGAGIWNSAFSRGGKMLRSSIVLLAEFFQVEPRSLILDSSPPPDSAPETPPSAEPLSIHVEGQHHQVIASLGGIIIQGSIIHTVAIPGPLERE